MADGWTVEVTPTGGVVVGALVFEHAAKNNPLMTIQIEKERSEGTITNFLERSLFYQSGRIGLAPIILEAGFLLKKPGFSSVMSILRRSLITA